MASPPRQRPEKKVRTPRPQAVRPGRQGRRRSPAWRAAVVLLALASAGTLAAGVFSATTFSADRSGQSGRSGRTGGTGPAQRQQAQVAAGLDAARPTGLPGGPVTNITEESRVAPLKRVIPPDVLAVARGSIDPGAVRRVRGIRGVQDVILTAGGQIELQGRAVNALAVEPSAFRSWTPPATAAENGLWEALAAGRFVVSHDAVRQLQLSLGAQYSIVARTVPSVQLGAAGPLVPGIDLLVNSTLGGQLGLVPNVALMVNAPGADPARLTAEIDRILGGRAETIDLNQASATGQATSYLDLYRQAATTCPGLSWTVLAAIGQVESDHGRNAGPSSAGALGPMQFMPATWRTYGVDGNSDGRADIMNPYDAIPAAAKYLCANGAGRGGRSLYKAIFAYNHADWYVQRVLGLARAYATRYG